MFKGPKYYKTYLLFISAVNCSVTLILFCRYLRQNGLCDRPRQTFMESRDQYHVEQICQGHGWRDHSHGNLCISNSLIWIYDLTVDNNCQIQKLDLTTKYVVVACDVVDNVCRPVHFERSTCSGPNPQFGPCKRFLRRDEL